VFTWLSHAGGVLPGSVAGNCNSLGYMVLGLKGKKYRQHRLAWLYVYGVWPVGTLDHLDADRANNRIANLRCVSQAYNNQNIKAANVQSKTGVRGVYWSKRKCGYMASAKVDGKNKKRGPFKTIEEGRVAYVKLKLLYHDGYVPPDGVGYPGIGTLQPPSPAGNSTHDKILLGGFPKHVNFALALNPLNRLQGVN
jgi:HNH endonuclease